MVELNMLTQNYQMFFSKEFHFTYGKKYIKQQGEVKQRFKLHSVFMVLHEDNYDYVDQKSNSRLTTEFATEHCLFFLFCYSLSDALLGEGNPPAYLVCKTLFS